MRDQELYGVRYERNALIPLDDGGELAADLCLPDSPGAYPTLVSFYPYHKDDFIGAFYEFARKYFAQRGYASMLVDFRGTGSSAGVCPETFDTDHEGRDGAQVVEWAAAQGWCDGNVGVWGQSYGGIMSLAVAAQRPPHLKAIAPIYGCSDIHSDFVAPGGCRNCLGTSSWLSLMLALELAPPSYQDTDERWLRVWRERLERLQRGDIWHLDWPSHPDHDEYWQAKVIPIERVEVPTFLIGGWWDIFAQAMSDAYERVAGPKKLLMGPWLHQFPDLSQHVGVDILHEMVEFFDQWLKGDQDRLRLEQPPVTVYVQGAERWRHELEWPIARVEMQDWHLQRAGKLGLTPSVDGGGDSYLADPTVGTSSTLWDPLGLGLGYPLEQAEDDLRSLTYTSEPLAEQLEITGSPKAGLRVTLDEGDDLQLVVKLNAVGPDGSSKLITTGWLSGAHGDSRERPESLERGVVTDYEVPLYATSYVVPAGYRLRVSISCSDFPRIWPLKTNCALTVDLAGSFVRLPIVPETAEPLDEPTLPVPDPTLNRAPWLVPPDPSTWKVERDAVTGDVSVKLGSSIEMRTPNGATVLIEQNIRATAPATRPDGAAVHAQADIDVHLPAGQHVQVRARSLFTRDTTLMNGEVLMDDRRLYAGEWQQRDA